MGYTHYVTRRKRLPLATFTLAVEDCRRVVEALCQEKGFTVQYDRDDPRPPLFGPDSIRFNGEGDHGHETFVIDRVYQPDDDQSKPARGEGWFEFTKTNRKPYDSAVCACLIVFHHHFGKWYSVSSDGEDDDEGWVWARGCCQRVLGYGAEFTLNVPPKITVDGLVLTGGWYSHSGNVVRDLSNGWRLAWPKRAEFRFMAFDPMSSDAAFITGGNTILLARWKATVAYFQVAFQDAPFLDEFVDAMQAMPGEWSSFLAWSDKLQDHGHDDSAKKIREHIPR